MRLSELSGGIGYDSREYSVLRNISMSDKSASSSRIGITLPADLMEKLNLIAEEKGTAPTTLAGRVLVNWLENYEEREGIKVLLKSLGSEDGEGSD